MNIYQLTRDFHKNNFYATQFHPEKSGAMGLKFYDNFVRLALGDPAC